MTTGAFAKGFTGRIEGLAVTHSTAHLDGKRSHLDRKRPWQSGAVQEAVFLGLPTGRWVC